MDVEGERARQGRGGRVSSDTWALPPTPADDAARFDWLTRAAEWRNTPVVGRSGRRGLLHALHISHRLSDTGCVCFSVVGAGRL